MSKFSFGFLFETKRFHWTEAQKQLKYSQKGDLQGCKKHKNKKQKKQVFLKK